LKIKLYPNNEKIAWFELKIYTKYPKNQKIRPFDVFWFKKTKQKQKLKTLFSTPAWSRPSQGLFSISHYRLSAVK